MINSKDYNKTNTSKNIYNLKWNEIKKEKHLEINIDFNLLKEENYKRIIRNFYKIKYKYVKKNKLSSIDIHTYAYDPKNSKQIDFLNAIDAIMKEDKKEMYNYIYDIVCDYLDKFFVDNNACDFNNDKCGEKSSTSCTVGCCMHYKNKLFGPILFVDKFVTCEYLKDKKCSAQCIACKLFTCDYLKRKGIHFKLKDIFLVDAFFNPIQKYFIKYKVFTPKENIIKSLLIFSIN